jgi:hypothetical protein
VHPYFFFFLAFAGAFLGACGSLSSRMALPK